MENITLNQVTELVEVLHSCIVIPAAHELCKRTATHVNSCAVGSSPLACSWDVKKDRKTLQQPSAVTARSSRCSAASMVSIP